MNFFNQIESKIIDILNEQNIDRISMAGIIGTLRQENLNESTLLKVKVLLLLKIAQIKFGV